MKTLSVPQGEFQLSRYPKRNNDQLRAWDAADAYLLRELGDPSISASVLIINDSFGALSVALADLNPQTVSDSFLAHRSTELNLQSNNLPVDSVQRLNSLQDPDGSLDLVLIKTPKTLALLEDQLQRIRPHLHSKTLILGAGMVKNIHTSTLQLFEKIIGPTSTSPAQQKARLIHCQYDPNLAPGNTPYPTCYRLENSEYLITNHANVFSRERLDIGTRLFLEQIPSSSEPRRIVDLGCGNGVVGLIAAERNPAAELIFIDESYMAVASAESNFRAAFGENRKAQFRATNCLEGIGPSSADLVLNNPPFHQQGAIGDHIAWEMFRAAKAALKTGGEIMVVGNRHLAYHVKLKRLFGNCKVVASNRKFVIIKSCKNSL